MAPLRPLAPSTTKLYLSVMTRAFGEETVPSVIPKHVIAWTESNKAILRAALKRRYREHGYSEGDASEIADSVPVVWAAQKVTEIPSEEEALRYEQECAQLPPGKHAMAIIPLAMGLRSREVITLPRRSVERATSGELIVQRKGGKEQVLDTSHCKGLFKELLEVRAAKIVSLFETAVSEGKAWKVAGEILSTGTEVAAYHALHRLVKEVGLRAGIEGMRPHKLRHSWATRMLRDGAPIAVIQWGLGHSSITTTQKYLHPQSVDVAKYMRKF